MYKDINIVLVNSDYINLIQIFNQNNNKIIESYIENTYSVKLEINNAYKIKIISTFNTIIASIYVTNDSNKTYIFDMQNREFFHKIFIRIIDQNYYDLLIVKGEIKLWPNHIQ